MKGALEGSTRKKKSTAEGLRRLRIGDAIQSLALVLPTNVIKKERGANKTSAALTSQFLFQNLL
uniref:Uncharacterized protein n=1 Tax=Romanomermis culicivorax TaxID=13658 RepID=A0A915IRW4_ROMCU